MLILTFINLLIDHILEAFNVSRLAFDLALGITAFAAALYIAPAAYDALKDNNDND